MHKSNRLLRDIIGPKHKEPHKERNIDVAIFEDDNKKAITGLDLQDDHPSISNPRADSNFLLYFFKMVDNEMVNYHKKTNSSNEKMRNEYVMNLCTNGCGV